MPKTRYQNRFPRSLRRFDDSRGIIWRAYHIARRVDPRWLAAFFMALPRNLEFRRPVFIIGASRSGTTLVFHFLRAHSGIGELRKEGHHLWNLFQHPRYRNWSSDHVGAGHVARGERRILQAAFHASGARGRFRNKKPENSLRVDYLLDLWSDARFIAVWRNPCDVVNSYINGWRREDGRFRSYSVPESLAIPGYSHRHHWCFLLFPGWRQFVNASVPRIALEQWKSYTQHLSGCRDKLPVSQWLDVRLEDLDGDRRAWIGRLWKFLELGEPRPELVQELDQLVANPPNVASPPQAGKWRQENPEEIEPLLPDIARWAPRAGYSVDPVTGAVAPLDNYPGHRPWG